MDEQRSKAPLRVGGIAFDMHAAYAEEVGLPYVEFDLLAHDEPGAEEDAAGLRPLANFCLSFRDAEALGHTFVRMAAGATFLGKVAIFRAICEERGDEAAAQVMADFASWFQQRDFEAVAPDEAVETPAA